MALSMDEQRMLAEIERRLTADDPLLATRLASFRLPRLTLVPRSQRSRLLASLLMLALVGVVSVFVYALMPSFRGEAGRDAPGRGVSPTRPVMRVTSYNRPVLRSGAPAAHAPAGPRASATVRSGSSGSQRRARGRS